MPVTRENGLQKVLAPHFSCHWASAVLGVSKPGTQSPSRASAGEEGGKTGSRRAQVLNPRRPRCGRDGECRQGQDLHGAKGRELGRIPNLDTVQGERILSDSLRGDTCLPTITPNMRVAKAVV